MPAQQRIDLAQHSTAQTLPALGQSAPLRIGQPESPAGELTAQGPVFFDQIGDDVLLVDISTTRKAR